jgi:Flp pilus assembly pilin Flp
MLSSMLSSTDNRLQGRGVNVLTFVDLIELIKTARKEEGQTMAEYAVVLAVITVATVAVFTALSGGISGAITNVTGLL